MNNEYLKKLADELKSVREKKKISIEEIFTKTRIDKKFLTAIEQGNFSIMPEVYIRAFIKEYSKTIGLNPDEILVKFNMAREGKDFDIPNEKIEDKKSSLKKETINSKIDEAARVELAHEPTDQSNTKNKMSIYILSALLMIIAIFTIYNLFLKDQSDKIITETPFEEIVENKKRDNVEENPKVVNRDNSDLIGKIEPKKVELIKPETTPKINEEEIQSNIESISTGDKLVLTLIGNTKSWIRIVSDETNNTEFILDSGMTKIITANERFYLHVGNSGGIKLLLNDKDLNFTGAPGKVRKIFVTQKGIEYLRRTPVTINAAE
jgi:cytoskeletal protein RodZ